MSVSIQTRPEPMRSDFFCLKTALFGGVFLQLDILAQLGVPRPKIGRFGAELELLILAQLGVPRPKIGRFGAELELLCLVAKTPPQNPAKKSNLEHNESFGDQTWGISCLPLGCINTQRGVQNRPHR